MVRCPGVSFGCFIAHRGYMVAAYSMYILGKDHVMEQKQSSYHCLHRILLPSYLRIFDEKAIGKIESVKGSDLINNDMLCLSG